MCEIDYAAVASDPGSMLEALLTQSDNDKGENDDLR
jgi:hypothetical protein